MRSFAPPLRACALVAVAATLSGCATRQSMDAEYEKALAQWQGASEELLVQRWGKPQSEEQIGSGKWLTFVVDNPGAASSRPTVGISIGGFGIGGGHTSIGGGVGVSAPFGTATPAAPSTCTTRFLIENGKVSTWTFDGPGCGASG